METERAADGSEKFTTRRPEIGVSPQSGTIQQNRTGFIIELFSTDFAQILTTDKNTVVF